MGVMERTCEITACALDGVLSTPLEGGAFCSVGVRTLSVGLDDYASDRTSPIDFVRALLRD